jgi:2'-5' RNA ligase
VTTEQARLFVALELPQDVVAALVQWRSERLAGVQGLRPTALESMHVTLCFLGSVSADAVDSIGTACGLAAGCQRPVLIVGEPLWLPPRRPRVLAVSIEDRGDGLAGLQRTLSEALVAGGWYAPEDRPFLPHVTMGRSPRAGRLARVPLPAPAPLGFVGSSVVLMRSRIGGAGARYERLHEVAVGRGVGE